MAVSFQKATKKRARLRLAFIGPSGSGKTFTSLRVATALGGRIAVIDSERGSASKYSDRFPFDVLELESFAPQKYVEAIEAAGAAGYDVLVIDSLSHAWSGKGGALEMVDQAAARSRAGNSFAAWREVTPHHNALVEAMLRAKCHVIATMRTKTEWILETNEKGKQVPKRVGLQPVQRDGLEYEFDVVGDIDEARLCVSKTRCPALHKAVIDEPGEQLAETLKAWLTDGADLPEPQREPVPTAKDRAAQEADRARAYRLREAAKGYGVPYAEFPGWVERVLGAPKQSTSWTEDDFGQLEAALQGLKAEATGAMDAAS